MPKRRKEGNKFTTISISWKDKELLRKFAQFKKETKNGKLYDSDAEIFNRVLYYFSQHATANEKGNPTYPTVLQDKHQLD